MKELNVIANSKNFSSVYIFYGDETFLSSFYSKKLCDKINEFYGMSDFNFAEFDGDKLNLNTLADTIEAMPMFAERKCVLLKDLNLSQLNAEDSSFFISCCENIPETTVLIITFISNQPNAKEDKWTRLVTAVKKNGIIAECSPPTRRELVMWMKRAASLDNATLEDETADYIIEKVGTDMRRIRTELAKLAAFADGQILNEHVDLIAVKHLDARVYDMVKCISAGKFAEAYRLLDEMFEMGEEPNMILGAISGAFADIYKAKLGKEAGKTAAEIAADFRVKEFRITNAMRDANRYSEEYLYRCIEAVALADNQLKSSSDGKLVLEKLIAAVAAAGTANG